MLNVYQPYPNSPAYHNYIFVPLPGLNGKIIERTNPTSGVLTLFSSETNYVNLPLLKSRVHPYHAIVNALPKLSRNIDDLSQEHKDLLAQLLVIEVAWKAKLRSNRASSPARTISE